MAVITGTSGNDTLAGTQADDVFRPLTGFDTVDGGAGQDRLEIDYSVLRAWTNRLPSSVVLDSAGLSGIVESRVGNDFVSFARIEELHVLLGAANDAFIFNAHSVFSGQSIWIDGGGGTDRIVLNVSPLGSVSFTAAADGSVACNFPVHLTGFEAFDLTLGNGNHTITTGRFADRVSLSLGSSAVATGAGADTITSRGGLDTIDGGNGADIWRILLEGSTTATSLTVDGNAATARLGNGASARNVEQVSALLGAGNDVVRLTDARSAEVTAGAGADRFFLIRPQAAVVDGGSGSDFATINMSGTIRFYETSLVSGGGGSFAGYLSLYDGITLSSIERIDAVLSDADDLASVDVLPLTQGAVLTLDGGAGTDHLTLDFSALAAVRLFVAADGSIRFSTGTFRGFESLAVTGTDGVDTLSGGEGGNVIDGRGGSDTLRGGTGGDILRGGDGNDTLNGLGGADELYGGVGNDRYYIDTADYLTIIYENAAEGTDTLFASVDAGLWENIEVLRLTGTADIAGTGTDSNNTIIGNAGSNRLQGLGGRDTLSGGAGTDVLSGGAGADRMTGGLDADQFWFDSLEDTAQFDTLTDFETGIDQVVLFKSAFAAFAELPFASTLPASAFTIGTTATTTSHRIIYDAATGALYYDADGTGAAAQMQVAALTGTPTLAASDVLIL